MLAAAILESQTNPVGIEPFPADVVRTSSFLAAGHASVVPKQWRGSYVIRLFTVP